MVEKVLMGRDDAKLDMLMGGESPVQLTTPTQKSFPSLLTTPSTTYF